VKQNKRYVFCGDDLENGCLFVVQRNGRESEGLLRFLPCFLLYILLQSLKVSKLHRVTLRLQDKREHKTMIVRMSHTRSYLRQHLKISLPYIHEAYQRIPRFVVFFRPTKLPSIRFWM
jgi:hypothetical protein